MSRYDEFDYDEAFPNQGALWRANADRALNGKRGRKALAELRDALRALPEKKLISGAMCTVDSEKRRAETGDTYRSGTPALPIIQEQAGGEGVCAVGAYLWWQKVKAGVDPVEAFDAIPTLDDENHGLNETAEAGEQAGLALSVAWDLAYQNDETYGSCTPEERYEKFMRWLDLKLGSETLVAS